MGSDVLYEGFICPSRRRSWKAATRLNHITPKMVAGMPTLKEEKGRIEAILGEADVIAGWNVQFDTRVLYAGGIDVPMRPGGFCDLMPAFCEAWGRENKGYRRRHLEKLERAVPMLRERLGGGFESYDAHDALGDTIILPEVWAWLVGGDSPQGEA